MAGVSVATGAMRSIQKRAANKIGRPLLGETVQNKTHRQQSQARRQQQLQHHFMHSITIGAYVRAAGRFRHRSMDIINGPSPAI
jgi:hypothetical protein